MAVKKICIIGNSVALRVRPPVNFPNNKNYSQLLRESLDENCAVVNLAYGASTVKEVYKKIDTYIREFPDYYIINLGVVDASTREVPLWFYRLSTQKSLNAIFVLFALLYRNIISKFRRVLVNIRGRRSWVAQKEFREYFDLIVKTLVKETNAKIIVLNINEANNRVEAELPGSLKKHKKYNAVMNEIAGKYNQIFVDTNKLIKHEDYPDGVHFSVSGHKKIFNNLFSIIKSTYLHL